MNGDLQDLRAQLKSVSEELARMPRHLAGTEWHTDRVNEAEWLVRTIARMELARADRVARAELN